MKLHSYQKPPQQTLFEVGPGVLPLRRWHDGALIDYVGNFLRLKLDTEHRQAAREADVLHLPLPPHATERQIQDAAESWLRREAKTLFSCLVTRETQRRTLQVPVISLSFSLRGGWAQMDGRVLRLNWRLIEQPLSVIELTLRRALAQLRAEQTSADLFSEFAF